MPTEMFIFLFFDAIQQQIIVETPLCGIDGAYKLGSENTAYCIYECVHSPKCKLLICHCGYHTTLQLKLNA